MQSFMRQKAGRHSCEKCQGQGCYSCERKGFVLSCPTCMSQTSQSKVDDDYRCEMCRTTYDKSGTVHQRG